MMQETLLSQRGPQFRLRPPFSVPALRGSKVIRLRPCMIMNTPPIYYAYTGWVGVGWQRHCKTCRSLLELDNQGTSLSFGGRSQLVVELDHLCGVVTLYSAQGE